MAIHAQQRIPGGVFRVFQTGTLRVSPHPDTWSSQSHGSNTVMSPYAATALEPRWVLAGLLRLVMALVS